LGGLYLSQITPLAKFSSLGNLFAGVVSAKKLSNIKLMELSRWFGIVVYKIFISKYFMETRKPWRIALEAQYCTLVNYTLEK